MTKMMQGLTIASLKKHRALIPLYVCLGIGVAMSTFYTLRLALRNPDVSWNRKGNPEPNQEYANKQYKFYSPIRDYSTYRAPVPNYKDEE
ncbi:cytochrome c oxidase subunit NDUFA4-like [Macrobrachium nipponense]|uniref:cytochrome c oxidase subunit NDUFA4-like n=1 Tax=Macrobrachium nipponense TaxID=159736 RepID=UPI0030C7B93C